MTRKERRKRKQKNLYNCIVIIAIIFVFFYIGIEIYNEKKQSHENNYYQVKKLFIEEYKNTTDEELIENKEYPKEAIIETYKGYDVLAKLEIPKIELETYIIRFSESALNISVTKFWGANPNETGNMCIAGHNFKKKNMFHNLKKLEIGDTLKIKDNNIGVIEYEIYNIYTVIPDDVTCLSQETNGKREVTLITCTSDSKRRIIIKAREC